MICIFGCSIGAINSAILGQFKDNEMKECLEKLNNLWDAANDGKVVKNWFPLGKIEALWKPSFMNSEPLYSWMEEELDLNKIRSSGKETVVNAVSLNTGKNKFFDQTRDDFIKCVEASASFPGFFLPVSIDNECYVDGGVIHQNPLVEAIARGAEEIVNIVLAPEYNDTFLSNDNFKNTMGTLGTSVSIMSNELMNVDIKRTIYYNELVSAGIISDKKYIKLDIIRPHNNEELSLKGDSFDFSQKNIQQMKTRGYQLAKEYFNKAL